MKTTALEKLLKSLKKESLLKKEVIYNYVIPKVWQAHLYCSYTDTKSGDILVNPYDYLISLIEKSVLPLKENGIDYLKSIATIKGEQNNGDWIKKSIAYSMMPRASAAYDHDRDGDLAISNMYHLKDTGTFVKSIALLPYLKKIGINLVYMLPIAEYTRRYKKGEMGSPYGVKNFYQIDPDLFDPITGDEMTVNEQFQAFVEACHIYGMRIALDYIPRTNARDSILVLQHPEWFYWIKKSDEKNYFTPYVVGVDRLTVPEPEHAEKIYTSPEVLKFIKLFKENPKDAYPQKWQQILEELKTNPRQNHLELIEKYCGLTVAPAFADVMNDPQPAWSDVTFFRLYLDHPDAAKPFLCKQKIPFMLFDIAKSSLNPGSMPNHELWDTLSDVIPFYQKEFGIDGMRIDMGHALPDALTKLIFDKARAIDPNFCFIAEELQSKRAIAAKKIGYNLFIGDGFYMEPRTEIFFTHEFAYNALNLPLPCFACCETHDTKRAAARHGGRVLSKMLTIMNLFLPNTVPFINSGQEVYELQPMNTGLDCTNDDALILGKNDPLYGKLALFDRYAYHYNNSNAEDLINTLEFLTKFREKEIDIFINPSNCLPLGFDHMRIQGIGMAYLVKDYAYLIIIHTNVDFAENITCKIANVRHILNTNKLSAELIYSTHEGARVMTEFDGNGDLLLFMQPGEVKIIKF